MGYMGLESPHLSDSASAPASDIIQAVTDIIDTEMESEDFGNGANTSNIENAAL